MQSDRFLAQPPERDERPDHPASISELTETPKALKLTKPQREALSLLQPDVWRGAFPDINPRTAAALWALGLVQGKLERGKRLFCLTKSGELARSTLAGSL
jgi:hypothetical protein